MNYKENVKKITTQKKNYAFQLRKRIVNIKLLNDITKALLIVYVDKMKALMIQEAEGDRRRRGEKRRDRENLGCPVPDRHTSGME